MTEFNPAEKPPENLPFVPKPEMSDFSDSGKVNGKSKSSEVTPAEVFGRYPEQTREFFNKAFKLLKDHLEIARKDPKELDDLKKRAENLKEEIASSYGGRGETPMEKFEEPWTDYWSQMENLEGMIEKLERKGAVTEEETILEKLISEAQKRGMNKKQATRFAIKHGEMSWDDALEILERKTGSDQDNEKDESEEPKDGPKEKKEEPIEPIKKEPQRPKEKRKEEKENAEPVAVVEAPSPNGGEGGGGDGRDDDKKREGGERRAERGEERSKIDYDKQIPAQFLDKTYRQRKLQEFEDFIKSGGYFAGEARDHIFDGLVLADRALQQQRSQMEEAVYTKEINRIAELMSRIDRVGFEQFLEAEKERSAKKRDAEATERERIRNLNKEYWRRRREERQKNNEVVAREYADDTALVKKSNTKPWDTEGDYWDEQKEAMRKEKQRGDLKKEILSTPAPKPEAILPTEKEKEEEKREEFTGKTEVLRGLADNLLELKKFLMEKYQVDEDTLRKGVGKKFYNLISGNIEGYLGSLGQKVDEKDQPDEEVLDYIKKVNMKEFKRWLIEAYRTEGFNLTDEILKEKLGQAYDDLGF